MTMDGSFEEKAGLCALNKIFGFSPRQALRLLEAFGSAREAFLRPRDEIERVLGPGAGEKTLSQLSWSAFESAAIELEGLEGKGCTFIGIGEDGYPSLLAECDDPPLGLYYRGVSPPEEVFDGPPAIAVIGTRNLTSYGADWCERIVSAMSGTEVRPVIVSGLALGVDVTAHRTALDLGIPTVAVMATGIDSIYPGANRGTGERIAATPGCALVTDYPPGTTAMPVNFLRRNRIIAGISRSTILVESRIRGGGMMTARLAASYDRDVFALPGRVDDPVSQGCNLLIRENLAESIGGLGELMEKLGLGSAKGASREDFEAEVRSHYQGLTTQEDSARIARLARTVKACRGISMDELCTKLDLDYSEVGRIVTMLECDGFISVDLLQHCSARMIKR